MTIRGSNDVFKDLSDYPQYANYLHEEINASSSLWGPHLHRAGHRIPNLLSSLFGLRSFAAFTFYKVWFFQAFHLKSNMHFLRKVTQHNITSLFTKCQAYLPCITNQNKEDKRHGMMGWRPVPSGIMEKFKKWQVWYRWTAWDVMKKDPPPVHAIKLTCLTRWDTPFKE